MADVHKHIHDENCRHAAREEKLLRELKITNKDRLPQNTHIHVDSGIYNVFDNNILRNDPSLD